MIRSMPGAFTAQWQQDSEYLNYEELRRLHNDIGMALAAMESTGLPLDVLFKKRACQLADVLASNGELIVPRQGRDVFESEPCVYAMQHEDGRVKIGSTMSLTRRTRALVHQHGGMSVIAYIKTPDHKDLEYYLLHRFSEFRINWTDWFYPGQPIVDWFMSQGSAETRS